MCCVQVREHTSHLEAELEKHMAAASAECQNYATEVAGVSVPVQVGLVGALRPGQEAARSAWQREDLSTRCGDTISAGKAFIISSPFLVSPVGQRVEGDQPSRDAQQEGHLAAHVGPRV